MLTQLPRRPRARPGPAGRGLPLSSRYDESPVTRVTLRQASAVDGERLRHLAELDESHAPSGPVLVAEVDGRLRAALPLDGSAPIADPFHRGEELIELLRLRAAQLVAAHRARRRRG